MIYAARQINTYAHGQTGFLMAGYASCVLMVFFCFAQPVRAQLLIEITHGNDSATPIAVVPFVRESGAEHEDIAAIIRSNMQRSGRFRPISPDQMLSLPGLDNKIIYQEWRQLKVEYIVVGKSTFVGDELRLDYALHSVAQAKVIDSGALRSGKNLARQGAHRLSDAIYKSLTGTRGAFATRIVYTLRRDSSPLHSLRIADADGGNDETLLESEHPILSPQWSPKADALLFVGFEAGYPSVQRYNFKTRRTRPLLRNAEYSSAPAWSPDGRYIATVLARDANVDIYLFNANGKELRRMTRHFGIDTEPNFTEDGRSILFTSDRNGTPQIYRVSIRGGTPTRLTHAGSYNARPVAIPNSRSMVMTHGDKGVYHIAQQNFDDRTVRVLSDTDLDESPTVSPNGHMLMYASNHKGRGVMVVVSLPGTSAARLQSRIGEIGEPAWSPFLH
jgi:TolB protein